MTDKGQIELIIPDDKEKSALSGLTPDYISVSEMSNEEREFLTASILRVKPKKLLEIGVSAGASSVVMLNAIKDFPESKLYSVELMPYWYIDPSKKAGFIADKYPQLKDKWNLFTGGLALNFIDKIAGDGGIDFCLIDTMHNNPGEILDLLMIFPYLKDNATVIFHDVKLHTYFYGKKPCFTNDLLMSALHGTKLIQADCPADKFPNIGGIKLDKESKSHIFELFNLLTLKWQYMPDAKQREDIINHFRKHYDEYYINYLLKVYEYQNKVLAADKKLTLKKIIVSLFGMKNIRRAQKLIGSKKKIYNG